MTGFWASIVKNFKNLLRNWASVFLIIIAPIILMSLIFLAFSDVGFQNIHIGYVVEDPARIDSFLDRISYVGNFVRHDSIAACHQKLREQIAHACLDVKLVGEDAIAIDVYVDNTREMISYILYGQIHRAMIRQRQQLIMGNVENSMTRLRHVRDFIDNTQGELGQTRFSLEEQKKDLVETRTQLRSARSHLVEKQQRLRALKTQLADQKRRVAGTGKSLYERVNGALGQARSTLHSVHNQVVGLGLQNNITGFDQAFTLIDAQQRQADTLKTQFDREISDVDSVIWEVDQTINELLEAVQFIDKTDQKINTAIGRIEQEQNRVDRYTQDLSSKNRELDGVLAKDAKSFATPIETSFNQMFSGSKRAREIELSLNLSAEQQARLVNFGSIQTLLPFVLAIMICFISIVLANILTLDEIHSPAFTRNLLAPGTQLSRLLALFATVFLTAFVQVVLILGIGYVVFMLDVWPNLLYVLVPLVLLVSVYAIIGMIIAYLVNDKSTSLLVSAFVMMMTLFLSGTVYPVERMSPMMEYIAQGIPFTSGISMLQQGLFYGVSIGSMFSQLIVLVVILAVAIIVLGIAQVWFLRRQLRQG